MGVLFGFRVYDTGAYPTPIMLFTIVALPSVPSFTCLIFLN